MIGFVVFLLSHTACDEDDHSPDEIDSLPSEETSSEHVVEEGEEDSVDFVVYVRTISAEPISANSAALKGDANIEIDEVLRHCYVGFLYSQHKDNTVYNSLKVGADSWSGGKTFEATLTNLSPNTTYYCRAYAQLKTPNQSGDYPVFYGNETWFQTADSHQAVDMGLSVRWADCNVGANRPTEFGSYVCWGDVNGTDTPCEVVGSFSISGNSVYDIAANLWGGNWRLPTDTEMSELLNDKNTTCTLTTQNFVFGLKVTSKSTGNSIFLPAGGSGAISLSTGERVYDHVGEWGEYWTGVSAPSTHPSWTDQLIYHYAYSILFYENSYVKFMERPRKSMMLVRPVTK